ncbi:MAG: hypothetical protein GTN68_17295 [Candidatus Aminicenantes bacterium]|nr:hypothetical protein [Candidatus Aminicenantes bacterium]
MNVFDDFERILSNFSSVEEPLLLRDIREFAEKHRDVVIKTFSVLFKNPGLDIQLKYLVLKSMGELKFDEFVPIINDILYAETNEQLIYEAVTSLTAIGSFSAYRVMVDFLIKNKKADFTEKIERSLRDIFIKNPLAYHFDVFYRDRGEVSSIEKSSEFLIKHLPHEHIQDILHVINSRYYKIRFQLLRILKEKPNSIFYANIFHYFKENYNKVDDDLFLMLSEALVVNASVSKAKTKIFQTLKEFVNQMEEDKKKIFCILLLKLNSRELIHCVADIYPQLDLHQKILVFNNLDPDDYIYYREFIRELLINENNETLLSKIVAILIRANEFNYLFAALDAEKGLRKTKLLAMILEHEPKEIDFYIQAYVTPSQDNRILYLSVEYLLRYAADNYFDLIKRIFFSGVSPEIKILIIGSVKRWNGFNQKVFMEAIFKNLNVITEFKKDFLFSLLDVLNEKPFDEEFEEKILYQILVMMEESPEEEMVNFIYFFDKYEINSLNEKDLIIDELRLIHNTLLKSSSNQNLVRMIHILMKNIEKKNRLKKV